jgi:hypothetical protein
MRTGPPPIADNGPRTNEVVTTTKIATMHLIIIPLSTRPRLKNFVCRVLKKTEARRTKIDERRRTFLYVDAKSIECNEAYEAFSAAC